MKFNINNDKFWQELEKQQKAAQEKEYQSMQAKYDKLLRQNERLQEELKKKTVRATRPVDLRFTGLRSLPYEHESILLSEHEDIVSELKAQTQLELKELKEDFKNSRKEDKQYLSELNAEIDQLSFSLKEREEYWTNKHSSEISGLKSSLKSHIQSEINEICLALTDNKVDINFALEKLDQLKSYLDKF